MADKKVARGKASIRETAMIENLMREKEQLNQMNLNLQKQIKIIKIDNLRDRAQREEQEKEKQAVYQRQIQEFEVLFRDLKQRLPKINRLNLTKSEKIAFWEQTPVRYIQYPDNETIEQMTSQELQPIRLGLFGGFQQYTLIAQFGTLPEFRIGSNKDHDRLKIQCEIDQYRVQKRISKIVYEREKMFPFYERFRIVSKEVLDKSGRNVLHKPQELGCFGKPYKNSQNSVRTQTRIEVNKKFVGIGAPPEDDFLVGIRIGLNKYGGIADIQFVYHKRT